MQHSHAQEQQVEMSLREQLLAHTGPGSAPPPYPATSASHHPEQSHPYPSQSDSTSPHDHHLDPHVTGQQLPYGMSGDAQMDDGMGQDRKGKRELSTSKRAAQNRAAQRAFRQRKEGYIKKLEEQVKDFQTMEQNYKALQNENYQLREYILNLQSRLLENQADFPPAPSHVNLSSGAAPPAAAATTAESSYGAEQQLRREMDSRPPLAPVVAREDPVHRDGIGQLQTATVRDNRSPYGLGNEYPAHQPQTQPEARSTRHDTKPA